MGPYRPSEQGYLLPWYRTTMTTTKWQGTITIQKNIFDGKEYLKFPISRDIINGFVKIKVNIINKIRSCKEKDNNLYIILAYLPQI